MPQKTTRKPLHCHTCNYDWSPRRDSIPARCPRCESKLWWKPKDFLTPAEAKATPMVPELKQVQIQEQKKEEP